MGGGMRDGDNRMKFPPSLASFPWSFAPRASSLLVLALFLPLFFPPARAGPGDAERSIGAATPPAAAAPPAAAPGFVVQSVPVNYLPAAEIKKLFQALVTPGGAALDQPGEKSLMLVDAPENIRRLVEIKDLIGVQEFAGARLGVFQPKRASADELSAKMTELLKNQVLPAPGPFFVGLAALAGVNQILAVSDGERAWNFTRPWLERLDAYAGPRRRLFIYPLERGKLAEVEEKLKRAWEGDKEAAGPAAPGPSAATKPRAKVDPMTRTLIDYSTPEDLQQIKKALDPARLFEEFKQKLAALRRDFEAARKKP